MRSSSSFRLSVASTLCGALLLQGTPVAAQGSQGSFSDVPPSHPAFAAVEYVKAQGIFKGYADGTFQPGKAVLRAEAMKILVLTKMTEQEVMTYTKRSFTDVPENAWYRPYAEAAMQKLGIIDGPPKATVLNGDKTVTKVQFLKMLLKSQDIDAAGAFGEIRLALATDVTDTAAWYYPFVRYAISSSLIQVRSDGSLRLDAALTRAEVALLLHRLAMYQAGKRTQALLSEEESELVNVLQALEAKEFAAADMASARALLAARGAHVSKPSVAIVQAAVKIAESFRALVRAYTAGTAGKLQEVIDESKEAWSLGDRANQLSPDLGELSGRVKDIAKNMADQAREMLKQEAASPK